MERFTVWAPHARRVDLVIDASPKDSLPAADSPAHRIPAVPRGDGWWEAPKRPTPGMRYAYSVDGSRPVADPRARSLPEGPHRFAEVVDPHFPWTDGSWAGRPLAGQVLYELHVGTFSPQGTFAGVIEKLDYLKDLGVTLIELMPVQPFGGTRNWGYDGVFWHAVHAAYGGITGLKQLVDAAHAKGLGVVLDVVYNHFGPDGNYTGVFGPYTAGGSTGWGEVVNLAGGQSDEVRRYILDAVRLWLDEFHIDGLRLDAVHSFDDRGAFSIMEEIQQVADEVAATTGVAKSIIAESDLNDARLVVSQEAGGYGQAGQWVDDIHHALHAAVSGEDHLYYADFQGLPTLADALSHVFHLRGGFSAYRQRHHGRPVDEARTPAHRFVTYTTTHDQVGNRPRGDRPSMHLTPAQQVLKAAVVYCSPYTPMLFQGEEFGATTPFPFFCSHSDDRLNESTRAGRAEFFAATGWKDTAAPDPAAPETFESARLDWDFTPTQEDIYAAHQRLLQLRRELRLARPRLSDFSAMAEGNCLVMDHGDVALIANFSAAEVTVPVGGHLVYSFTSPKVSELETTLDPWGFALLRRASSGRE